MSRNVPRCEKCGSHLVCHSDAPFGYGQITWLHDGPCVRPEHPPVIGYCYNEECEKPVYGICANKRRKSLWCSEECRKVIAEARHAAQLVAMRKYQTKRRKILAGIKRREAA